MSNIPATSQTWLQNFRPYVNGERVRWPDLQLNLAEGESCEIMLEFEYSYLIGDPESALVLCCVPDAGEMGLVSDPPFGQQIDMAQGLISLSWTITTDQVPSSSFKLHFEMPNYQGMPQSPVIPGEILNFAQEMDVLFDSFHVGLRSEHHGYPCHGTTHTITVLPKPSSQLLNKHIKLITGAESVGVVVSPPPQASQQLTAEGIRWQLDCRSTSNDAEFSIRLSVDDGSATSSALPMTLGHNLVTAYRWREEHYSHPDITWYSHHIRATSVFLGKPALGVQVEVIFNGSSSYRSTDSKGEVHVNDQMGNGDIKTRIRNRYDETDV
ncbi:hypothetical protein [Pseudomonas sp. HS6]|uniref:hypothetical protein n=1 Tax=Pseudomonas sp. HS6 TaxID=2850559 RepID=UPI0020190C1A|nr:hypothetical protein [Pseudomonas sp. HS6]UQS17927.1 hypothetical protein JJN09_13995 [Pseudomonas sp. HS6]